MTEQNPHRLALAHDTPRVRAVKRRIAAALLPPLPSAALGAVQLLPHQRQAAARLLPILQRHHGAVLADAVGLGKTYTALAVAQRYPRAHVIAPAGLLSMWHAALLRTGQRHLHVHSLHRASYRPLPPLGGASAAPSGTSATRSLVIIDEAHALRNAGTARYRHVAQAVSGCDVLLLSATPLHNTPHDLHALFALFRGDHATPLGGALLETLIVRREQVVPVGAERGRAKPPVVRVHRPFTVPQHRETLNRLLALPAPLPARDGAVAGALIRMGLLRAWCSSDAALTAAIATRLRRGAALRDALEAGRHPTAQELRSWLVGDDAGAAVQLGFPELLADQTIATDQQQSAMTILTRHCDALRSLRDVHRAHTRADTARAAYVRAICRRHPGTPVVAFSQHARTVQALFRALSDIAGVGLLAGSQARIASGPVSRPELLGWFAPRAQGRPPPPESLRVMLLLTTDLLAEGVNLQDAGVVIHLDLPWTHALRTQRTGRIVRLGSPHHTAHEYRLRAIPEARHVLRLESTVARKAAITAKLVGDQTGNASARAATPRTRSAPQQASAWAARLAEWESASPAGEASPDRGAGRGANLTSQHGLTGALLLVRTNVAPFVLAVVRRDGRWWLSTRPGALLAVSEGRDPRCSRRGPEVERRPDDVFPGLDWRVVRRLASAWWRRRRARETAGTSGTLQPVAGSEPLNRTQRLALRWVQAQVQEWTAVERVRHAVPVREATSAIARARGAGADVALRAWMATTAATPLARLEGWRAHPGLYPSGADGSAPAGLPASRVRVEACLFITPA
jgi:hypothetical protein